MPTTEEQKAAAAKRSREYRDRKRREKEVAEEVAAAERDARDAAAESKPFKLVDSVEAAIAAMKWIRDSDGALVDMAKFYAVQIDKVISDDPTATGKAASLGQLLTRILHELGGTPTVRLQHELRSLRLAAGLESEDGDHEQHEADRRQDDAAQVAGGAIVSSIQRPPKRTRSA